MVRGTHEQAHVSMFGQEVNEQNEGRSNILGGVTFLVSGTLLLLNNMNVIPWGIWEHVWKFWPVIIIFIGLNFILGGNRFSRLIVGLLALITFLLIVVNGLVQVHSPLVRYVPVNILSFVTIFNYLKHE
ncbi:hypothetical protein HGB07_03470 [Candidatus Roizmanbacteria bacterium]|nr:hypothetical protein [Candidatus Roizmanbacteria bacterium]